jgi:hypothetical protein
MLKLKMPATMPRKIPERISPWPTLLLTVLEYSHHVLSFPKWWAKGVEFMGSKKGFFFGRGTKLLRKRAPHADQ